MFLTQPWQLMPPTLIMPTGSPVLSDALATFDCRLIDAKDVSTHRVLFGEVTGLKAAFNLSPLIYHNRGYHSL